MKHFTKITMATAVVLLSSTSLTWAQNAPKSVMDMLAAPPKADAAKSGTVVQPVIKKPAVKTPVVSTPVAPAVKPPVVAQPVVAPPVVAAPPSVRPPEAASANMPVVTALPEPAPPAAPVAPPAAVAENNVVPPSPEAPVAAAETTPPTIADIANAVVAAVEPPPQQVPQEVRQDVPQEAPSATTIPAEVKASLENDFKDKLKFPMTEKKMFAFIRAGQKVEDINSRWDVEIAAAESDKVAMENNNFAVEDIKASLSSLKDLTLDEYNQLSLLTTVDENFANLVATYREFLKQGANVKENTDPTAVAVNNERMDAVESQIKTLKSEIEAKQVAMTNPAPTAGADPLAVAQIDALAAKVQQLSERLATINQRAADIEKKVKTN